MRLVAGIAATILVVPVGYGCYLVATPDEDGGRRPAGLIVLSLSLVVALIVAAFILDLARKPNRRD